MASYPTLDPMPNAMSACGSEKARAMQHSDVVADVADGRAEQKGDLSRARDGTSSEHIEDVESQGVRSRAESFRNFVARGQRHQHE